MTINLGVVSGTENAYRHGPFRGFAFCLTLSSLVFIAPTTVHAASAPLASIAAAISDPSRPTEDVARDVDRKPAATLRFAGVKPGDKVADYVANTGYFTRLLAGVVGPGGHVYSVMTYTTSSWGRLM